MRFDSMALEKRDLKKFLDNGCAGAVPCSTERPGIKEEGVVRPDKREKKRIQLGLSGRVLYNIHR